MRKLAIFLIAMALLLGPAVLMAADEAPPAASAPAEGETAPAPPKPYQAGDTATELMVGTMDGKTVDLAKLVGKRTVVVIMNTACSACIQEMEEIKKLWILDKTKFDFAAISVDMAGASTIGSFEGQKKYGITYYLDPDFKVPPRFGFSFTPAMFILDQGGKILYVKGGWLGRQAQKTMAEIKQALAK